MKKPLKFELYWHSFGYVLVGIVIVLSLGPPPDFPLGNVPWIDKFFHFLAYGFLMLWFTQLYTRSAFRALALIFCLLGVGLEMAQSLTDDRSFEVADMVANGVGVLLGWGLAVFRLDHLLESFEKFMLRKKRS